jgi:hypothetical protein
MFGAHVGVTSFAMFYGFVEMINPFAQMLASTSHLRKLQRRFRMFHKLLSMPLFAMGYRLLGVVDGLPDITQGGRVGVHHGHINDRSKRSQNEDTTVEFADQLYLPPGLEFTAENA